VAVRLELGGGYAERLVARLAELRAGERDFEAAWETAMLEMPPPFAWVRRAERGQPSALGFLEQQCRRAWFGEGAAARLHRPGSDD